MSYANLVREAQKELFGWIPYKEYSLMFPSETREVIRTRLREGVWQLGVHATRGSTRKELWLNLRNIKAWLEGQAPPDRTAPPT